MYAFQSHSLIWEYEENDTPAERLTKAVLEAICHEVHGHNRWDHHFEETGRTHGGVNRSWVLDFTYKHGDGGRWANLSISDSRIVYHQYNSTCSGLIELIVDIADPESIKKVSEKLKRFRAIMGV